MDKHTQFNDDGSVNVVASNRAHSNALAAWVAEHDIPVERISNAVNSVLDAAVGRVLTPTLCNMAATNLGATSANHRAIAERVHTFVKHQINSGVLFVSKGPNGGVSREPPTPKA